MTLYYSLVFLLLVAEMTLFMLLIVPLPFAWRLKLYTFINSVNRVYRVQVELSQATESTTQGRAAVMGAERMEVQARKFYSQRNMYLCGFTLFLSLILNRTYMMILETLKLETKLKQYEGDAKASGKQGQKIDQAGGGAEIGNLRKKLEQKERDLENLKKQSEGLNREYRDLSDKYANTQSDGTPKKDR